MCFAISCHVIFPKTRTEFELHHNDILGHSMKMYRQAASVHLKIAQSYEKYKKCRHIFFIVTAIRGDVNGFCGE